MLQKFNVFVAAKKSNSFVSFPKNIIINWNNVSFTKNSKIEFGEHCIIKGKIDLQKPESFFKIGKQSFIGVHTTIVGTSEIIIGDDVLIAHDCYIIDTDGHSLDSKIRTLDIPNRWRGYKDWTVVESKPIYIGSKAWIGPRSTILKGVTIGAGAIVAAGSVVTHDVAPYSLVAGTPAHFVKGLS